MFEHLLESSRRDDSNKWSNIGFGEEITQAESRKVKFTLLIGIYGQSLSWMELERIKSIAGRDRTN